MRFCWLVLFLGLCATDLSQGIYSQNGVRKGYGNYLYRTLHDQQLHKEKVDEPILESGYSSQPMANWVSDYPVCQRSTLDSLSLNMNGDGHNATLLVSKDHKSAKRIAFGLCPWKIQERNLGEDSIPPKLYEPECLCNGRECAGGRGRCQNITEDVLTWNIKSSMPIEYDPDFRSVTIGCLCLGPEVSEPVPNIVDFVLMK